MTSLGKLGGRIVLATLIAPLWAPILFWLWAVPGPQPTVGYADIVALVATVFAYLAMLVIGVPAFFLMRRLGWVGLRAATSLGAAAGLIASYLGLVAVFFLGGAEIMGWSALRNAFQPILLLASTGLGALVAATFWIMARPDRAAAP